MTTQTVLTFRTMSALDHVDLELLAALSADPRATVVALAERLGLSRNTVQARMSRLEKAGVFLSYERAISDRKSTRQNSSHMAISRMPSSA